MTDLINKHPVPNNIHLPFQKLEHEVRSVVLERREEVHTAILALLGRQHHFVLGAPGGGKTMMVDQITSRISGAKKFDILLTRYSQPEEVFGGPNVKVLAETGIYERVTTNMLPECEVVFLDEIFKCNAALLNALLKAINERKFTKGGGINLDIPLHSLFSASNELAQADELAALWDRLHYRHLASPIQETSNFVQMLSLKIDPNPTPVLSMDDINEAYELVKQVEIPTTVYQAIVQLKGDLAEAGIEVTDRRWREAVTSIQAEAFYQGHMVAEVEDMRPLMHMLWDDPANIKVVRRLVLELSNPLEKEAAEWLDRLDETYRQTLAAAADTENVKARSQLSVELYKKAKSATAAYKKIRKAREETGRELNTLDELGDKIKVVGKYIMVLNGQEEEDELDDE